MHLAQRTPRAIEFNSVSPKPYDLWSPIDLVPALLAVDSPALSHEERAGYFKKYPLCSSWILYLTMLFSKTPPASPLGRWKSRGNSDLNDALCACLMPGENASGLDIDTLFYLQNLSITPKRKRPGFLPRRVLWKILY